MNKLLTGTLCMGMSVLSAGALTACNHNASAEGPQYAKVISATPIKQTSKNPQQQCHNEAVTERKPVKDEHQILGTAIGAVAGGVLGNQVGGGNGKKLATVAGAVGGGYAGKKIQEHNQDTSTETKSERRCTTVNHPTTKVVGYTVRYKYNGTEHTTRMDHDPGDQVQVQQGVSVSDSH